jgi:hypothetical protein
MAGRTLCTFDMTITETESTLTGTAHSFNAGLGTGTLGGTIVGSHVLLSVTWDGPTGSCPWLITADVSGSQWTATLTTNCPGNSGQVPITIQR